MKFLMATFTMKIFLGAASLTNVSLQVENNNEEVQNINCKTLTAASGG